MPFARLLDCSKEQYHADPTEVPSLSYSVAKILLTESPMHAYYYHPRLGGHVREQTKAMGKGQVIHKLLLGIGADIVVVRADNFRTKAAQELRDAAIAAGKTPIIAHEYDGIVAAAETIRERLAEYDIDLMALHALREQAFEWDEETENGPVRCRGMADYLDLTNGVLLDPKSAACAHPLKVKRIITDMAYDIQAAAYSSAVEKLNPELLGRVDFGWTFVELEAPYAVLPARPTESMKEMGRMRWRRAVLLWQKCLSTGKWPGYSDGWVNMAPTDWAMSQELEAQE
jgi:hypothetical protein